MKRIWTTATITALLCAALCAGAYAADPSYSGRIDPETGAALDVQGPLDGTQSAGRVYIGGDTYYDYDAHCYVYDLGGGAGEVRCDAADGMVLTGTRVSVRATQDAPVTFYRNGAELPAGTNEVSDVGEYTVVSQAEGRTRQLLKFTIVGASTNAVNTFTAPDGFYVVEATRDETEDAILDRYSVNMEPEGQYHIVYTCSATEMSYTLDVAVDRTPPEVTLSGRFDENMRARSAVSFSGLQPGDTIWATDVDGNVSPEMNDTGTGGTFYDVGHYTLTVYDAAGNNSAYEFVILTYFNFTSLMFFALVLLCAAAVFLYVRFKRKKLKIG